MRQLLFLLLSGITSFAWGQTSSLFQKMKATYPDDMSVFVERSKYVTLLVKDDSLHTSASVSETVLFLKDQTNQSTDWRVYGSYFQEVENLQAKALIWENNRYKELKMTNFTKKQEDDNSVFYDDSYFYSLIFPAATAGNQASWSYTEKYKDPKFLPTFYFSGYLP